MKRDIPSIKPIISKYSISLSLWSDLEALLGRIFVLLWGWAVNFDARSRFFPAASISIQHVENMSRMKLRFLGNLCDLTSNLLCFWKFLLHAVEKEWNVIHFPKTLFLTKLEGEDYPGGSWVSFFCIFVKIFFKLWFGACFCCFRICIMELRISSVVQSVQNSAIFHLKFKEKSQFETAEIY